MNAFQATAPLVAPLAAFGRTDLAVAGGKGANLGELVRAGFSVPPGFVITTRAYKLVVLEHGLASAVEALAKAGSVTPAGTAAARTLRESFEAAPIPAAVAEAVRAALRDLGPDPVAVRSSATAEDLPGAAFAGQMETFLNVAGADAVLDAVRRCWASLWAERAVDYRRQRGIDHAAVSLAVVVQRLISADVAGVLFTANPVTGARDELVVDASPGLGEAVVSGAVTPDHYVLKKHSHQVVSRQLGRREVVIRPAAGGGTESLRPEESTASPALAAADLDVLGHLGEAVERHYGVPQDLEWAIADGRLFLLQARPITALPPAPPPTAHASAAAPSPSGPPRGRAKRWRGFRPPNFAGELFPFRPYPLDVTSHMRVLMDALGTCMTGPLGAEFPSVQSLVVEENGLPVGIAKLAGPRPSPRLLYRPWLSLWERRHVDTLRWEDDPVIAETARRSRDLERRDLAALSWDEVLATFRAALALIPRILSLRERYLIVALKDTGLLWLLLRAAGQQRHFGALLSGIQNKTVVSNRALEDLAATVRAAPELRRLFAKTDAADLPAALARAGAAGSGSSEGDSEAAAERTRAFREQFERFLEQYGHRETNIAYLSQPTWKDAPAIPLGVVKSLALTERTPSSGAKPSHWEVAREEILAHSILGKGPLRRVFLDRLARGRVLPQLREDTHFYIGLPHAAERRAALELGRRLAGAGALAAPEDVFLLRLEELEPLGQFWPPADATVRHLHALVEDRRTRRAALADVPVVEADAGGATDPRDAAEGSEGALLSGQPGSAGVVEGPVRVIRGPADFGRLQRGEVLVAPFTNPSWTPLFPLACAVVVDTGASMSHAAIVAREYGVPAVMGTRTATTMLRDGQRIRVDGTRGLVFRAGV